MNREIDSLEYYLLRLEEELNDLAPDDPDIKYIEDELCRIEALIKNIKNKNEDDK